MKLDTVARRRKFVDDLRQEALKFMNSIDEMEQEHDWCGGLVIHDDLVALLPLIDTEKIFLDALDEMRYYDCKEQANFLNIVSNNLDEFISVILMHKLNHTVDSLHDWGFREMEGKSFYRSMHKKLDALVEKYQDLYDL